MMSSLDTNSPSGFARLARSTQPRRWARAFPSLRTCPRSADSLVRAMQTQATRGQGCPRSCPRGSGVQSAKFFGEFSPRPSPAGRGRIVCRPGPQSEGLESWQRREGNRNSGVSESVGSCSLSLRERVRVRRNGTFLLVLVLVLAWRSWLRGRGRERERFGSWAQRTIEIRGVLCLMEKGNGAFFLRRPSNPGTVELRKSSGGGGGFPT